MNKQYDQHNKLYDSVRWRKIRAMVLQEEPLCRLCARQGRDTKANTVDHIKPHNDDLVLFLSRDNLQALCASCHSGVKRMQENHGYSQATGIDGHPLDANHPWNR